ncbi:MAG: ABC transporter ATP-binding protein [candidate division Zixibacteria bacterium HGW-Zixibacteria-1]|nr:MAG: ABC transporter ATP-binding protein [candidate division Zixibacteria bacterium HGW-Zixibacteria-1]
MDAYIKFDNVNKSFDDKEVLRGVSLEVARNESIVIIGQSGCGKSVLLKHINALIKPESGSVYVDGNDVTDMNFNDLTEVRKNIGMLFQSAALLDSLTVGENVGLALKECMHLPEKERDDIIAEKLALVGLSGTEQKYPAELSGGMRKRVGLARAIATNPAILLYDEPTTGLDPITADRINDLIINLHTRLHVTSVTVTHDMTSAYKVGQRIVMLYDGKVEFEGTPDETRNSSNSIVRQFIHGQAEGPIKIN